MIGDNDVCVRVEFSGDLLELLAAIGERGGSSGKDFVECFQRLMGETALASVRGTFGVFLRRICSEGFDEESVFLATQDMLETHVTRVLSMTSTPDLPCECDAKGKASRERDRRFS